MDPSPGGLTSRDTDLEALLGRLRDGDRDAGADLLESYGARIRQRVRRRLSPRARRLFDSQEVLSTVARRLDRMIDERRVRAESPEELWGLLFRITDRSIVDKGRAFRRLRRAEGDDAPVAALMARRLAEPSETEGSGERLASIFESIESAEDRELLALWLRGLSHGAIASVLGLPEGTVRRRWHTLRVALRDRLEAGPW